MTIIRIHTYTINTQVLGSIHTMHEELIIHQKYLFHVKSPVAKLFFKITYLLWVMGMIVYRTTNDAANVHAGGSHQTTAVM